MAMGLKAYQQRQKRDEMPVGRRLSTAEVRDLRRAVDDRTNKGKRDLAILDTMLFAGLRREEVASLRIENLRQDGAAGGSCSRVREQNSPYKSAGYPLRQPYGLVERCRAFGYRRLHLPIR